VVTGVSGGLGGLFGVLALPIEVPLTTTLMLQSIADIARHYREDLRRPVSRIACQEVFALGIASPGSVPNDYRRASGRAIA
jgi:hypothetical protein